jgi:hypothetical protein
MNDHDSTRFLLLLTYPYTVNFSILCQPRDKLTLELVEPMQWAVLRYASRVQPSQRRIGGLVRREEALHAQLVKGNVVGVWR